MEVKKGAVFLVLLFIAIGSQAQNGEIISKRKIDLKQSPAWKMVSVNEELKQEYQHLQQLDFYSIVYQSDTCRVRGLVVEPKENGIYPVVIFNRGGNRNFAPLNLETLIMYTSQLSAAGFVIVASNYRELDQFGGNDLNDVLILMETVKEIPRADTSKIGMFGWSRGGMMTYMSLRKSNKIKTAIVGNGPSNLFSTIKERPGLESKVLAECIPNYYENKDLELRNRSATFWVNEISKESSLLILCGTKDKRVSYKQSEHLAQQLIEADYRVELKKFDTDHFFTNKKLELNRLVVSWFQQNLK